MSGSALVEVAGDGFGVRGDHDAGNVRPQQCFVCLVWFFSPRFPPFSSCREREGPTT